MARQFKHAYSVITANFEIESVIADYFGKHPTNEYSNYQIVFKTTDEHADGEFTYIIVFERNLGTWETRVTLYDFLKSHCVCNDLVAAMNPVSHVLAQIGSGHTFGESKKV